MKFLLTSLLLCFTFLSVGQVSISSWGTTSELNLIKEVEQTADLTINSTTEVDIPGLSFAVQSGEKYWFQANVDASQLNANSDLNFGWTAPVGTTGSMSVNNSENGTVKKADPNGFTTNIAVASSSGIACDNIYLVGKFVAGADGVIQIQVRNNSGTNSQTFTTQSFLLYKKF